MATENKPVATEKAAAKTFVAFFTKEGDSGPKVEIFKSTSEKAKAPLFDGKVGNDHVSLFLRNGTKGHFLGVVGNKDAEGKSPNLGTANVVTTKRGTPRLAINMKDADGKKTVIFASISKKVDQEMLVKIGLNETKQATKRAAAAAEAVASAEKKPAPAPAP